MRSMRPGGTTCEQALDWNHSDGREHDCAETLGVARCQLLDRSIGLEALVVHSAGRLQSGSDTCHRLSTAANLAERATHGTTIGLCQGMLLSQPHDGVFCVSLRLRTYKAKFTYWSSALRKLHSETVTMQSMIHILYTGGFHCTNATTHQPNHATNPQPAVEVINEAADIMATPSVSSIHKYTFPLNLPDLNFQHF